jgi:putative hydrolase of the HAD superfamily
VTFDAALFDLDNTLCRHEQSAETIYRGAFERAGLDLFGEPADLWNALDGDPPPNDPAGYLATGFARVAARHGHGETVDTDALAAGFLETVDYRVVSFLPGAERALSAAADHGPVGLVTNGPASRQSVKLDALGLADTFDVVVYAGDLPRRKPHPDPFVRAVETLDIDPGTVLYVGDSVEYDVVGAHRAGLLVAWLADGNGWSDDEWGDVARPTYVLDGLDDLVDLLHGDGSGSSGS